MVRYVYKRICKDCGEEFEPGQEVKSGRNDYYGVHQKYCRACLYKRNPVRYKKFKIYLKTTMTLK